MTVVIILLLSVISGSNSFFNLLICGGSDVSAFLEEIKEYHAGTRRRRPLLTHPNLSAVVGSEYCERELSSVSISSRHVQSICRTTRSGMDLDKEKI